MSKDYSDTTIYKLFCKDETITDIYIGHTLRLNKRKWQHKINCNDEKGVSYNSKVYTFIREHGGFDNWDVAVLEKVNCENKRKAEYHEWLWIQKLKPTLNTVLNPYALYAENPVEYKQNWYNNNKEHVLEKAKENYEKNKEKKLEYQKEYSEKHKEQIRINKKHYEEKNKEHISAYKKIYREKNKEQIRNTIKAWIEKHKDKIKEKQKEQFTCECGSTCLLMNKNRHCLSKSHLDYIYKMEHPEEYEESQIQKEEQQKEKELEMKEKQKEYREKHKDRIEEYKKKYYEENKEKIAKENKTYYEQHKEEIIKKTAEYVKNNKEKVNEYKQQYYQKNKDKIKEKNKEKIVCECGSSVNKCGLAEHYRSTKHKNYINNNILNT